MSFGNGVPLVRPQINLVPRRDRTDGEDAVEVAAAFGLSLDDWQQYSLVGALGRVRGGRWSAGEVGLEVPRQNGKTVILLVRCLWGLWGTPERLVTGTAHEYKTAREAFLDIRSLIENSPFASDVKAIRTFPQLEIELRDGSRVIFLARTSGSGRGFSGDCVILDEAYKLTPEQMAALMPTLSARPDPQLWYASMTGLADSEHLRSVRNRALADAERLCYLAWAADLDGRAVDLDDRDGWQRANPGLPHRISWEAVEQERAALSDEDFARERLGIWDSGSLEAVINPDTWVGLEDLRSRPGEPLAFGVNVSLDEKHAVISVAGRRPDGRKHVELVPCCSMHAKVGGQCGGTAWVAKRVAELDKKWKPTGFVLYPGGPAGKLILPIANAGVEPILVSGRELAQACGAFATAAMEDGLRHLGQPELNAAVDAARKRKLGDLWIWHAKDSAVDVKELYAATLAAHGVDKKPKKRRKTGRAMAV